MTRTFPCDRFSVVRAAALSELKKTVTMLGNKSVGSTPHTPARGALKLSHPHPRGKAQRGRK
jgi:hypothetical protein